MSRLSEPSRWLVFEHKMVLSEYYPDSIPEPKWVTLYNEWTIQKNAYKQRFMTDKALKNHSNFLTNIIEGIQSAIEITDC